jgi:hypothetical protein
MSKKSRPQHRVAGMLGKVSRPPEKEPWVWHTRELLSSPAWRAMTLNCRLLIEFLELDHMAHAGSENGHLHATYGQLQGWGIPRTSISRAVGHLERLGLIAVTRGGYRAYAKTNPTRYRLTYLPDKQVNEWDQTYYGSPTNDWKRVTEQQARSITSPEALTKTYEHQRRMKPELRVVKQP